MKSNELVVRVQSGECIMVGEYRHTKVEEINWRDKQTGRAMSGIVARHTVEFGQESVTVNERVPDGAKISDVKLPFSKGQTVALLVTEFSRAKGIASARGLLEPFEEAPASPGSGAPVGAGAVASAKR